MSIFKGTFADYVKKQINRRQDLLNTQGDRPLDLQKYVSGKAPWIKKTSFVDYVDPKLKQESKKTEEQKKAEKDKKTPKNDGVDPMALAKNYVLQGGTLYKEPGKDISFKLRSGLFNKSPAYDLKLKKDPITKEIGSQYGIRPMPGITSVQIKSKSAYGSLREAIVKFFAWDVNQLEDLLILYMRPGYPVLLEWGWSMYIDNESGKVKSFDSNTINCFESGLTQDGIYAKLDVLREKYSGNYDGMLGLIRNYETSMLPNGGFECTTTLISIGDVIDSLRMNSENGDLSSLSKPADPPANNNTQSTQNQEIKDEFEKLLNAFQYTKTEYNPDPASLARIKQIDLEAKNILDIDTEIYYAAGYTKQADGKIISNDGGVISRYYMQFAYFIHILNSQKNLYNDSQKILDIEIPLSRIPRNIGNGLCIASTNSMTVDNNTCIIKNSKATFISSEGFVPKVIFADRYTHPESDETNDVASKNLKEYIYESTSLGIIGNVYVNIGKLIDLYKTEHKKNNGFVYLGKYIKSVLSEMEFALGSINNFDIFVNDNKTVIIDKHYTENPSDTSRDKKVQINILGTDSVVRNQKIVSKIFPSQATIIAIAAQSRQNVAALQSSTYNYMNAGLKSRLISKLNTSAEDTLSDIDNERNLFYKNLQSLSYYVNNYITPFSSEYNNAVNINSLNTFLNNFLVRVDKGTNYKAIIPVSLEISLDGIGGVVIGQIFVINKDILPKEYAAKNVGFIVTGISHDISRPDWTTTLSTQFCLLDQHILQELVKSEIKELNLGFAAFVQKDKERLLNSVNLHNVLVGFFVDIFKHRIELKPVDGTYNTSVKSRIVYKERTKIKNLKALIEQYKPVYNGSPITVEDIIFEAEKCVDSFLNGIYQRDKAATGSKVVAFGNVKELVEKFNDITPEIFSNFDSSDQVATSPIGRSMIEGTASYPNKYYNALTEEVKTIYKSGLDSTINALNARTDGALVFKLLNPSSVTETGLFIPKPIDTAIVIKKT